MIKTNYIFIALLFVIGQVFITLPYIVVDSAYAQNNNDGNNNNNNNDGNNNNNNNDGNNNNRFGHLYHQFFQ